MTTHPAGSELRCRWRRRAFLRSLAHWRRRKRGVGRARCRSGTARGVHRRRDGPPDGGGAQAAAARPPWGAQRRGHGRVHVNRSRDGGDGGDGENDENDDEDDEDEDGNVRDRMDQYEDGFVVEADERKKTRRRSRQRRDEEEVAFEGVPTTDDEEHDDDDDDDDDDDRSGGGGADECAVCGGDPVQRRGDGSSATGARTRCTWPARASATPSGDWFCESCTESEKAPPRRGRRWSRRRRRLLLFEEQR